MGSGRALLARLRHLHRSRRCRAVLRDDGVDALARAVRRGHGRLAAGARRDRARRSPAASRDRKSTRLNSSHTVISYAVFSLKKKKWPLWLLMASAAARKGPQN